MIHISQKQDAFGFLGGLRCPSTIPKAASLSQGPLILADMQRAALGDAFGVHRRSAATLL
jgi:hypothetical protein